MACYGADTVVRPARRATRWALFMLPTVRTLSHPVEAVIEAQTPCWKVSLLLQVQAVKSHHAVVSVMALES